MAQIKQKEASAIEVLERMRERQRTASARRRAALRAAGKKSVTVWIPTTVVDAAKDRGVVPLGVIYGTPGTKVNSLVIVRRDGQQKYEPFGLANSETAS